MEAKTDQKRDPKVASGREDSKSNGKKHESISRTGIVFYAALAIVVVLAVAFAASRLHAQSYRVSVTLSTNTTASYPYQTTHFIIKVTNSGNSSIKGLNLGFYLNGSAVQYNTVDLPAGTSAYVHENYTYMDSGDYIFSAVADPAHVLNLKDRTGTQSSLYVSIVQPSSPDVFTSLPNSDMVYTQSFTLNTEGILAAAATAGKYNVSVFTGMFSPSQNILVNLFENLYGFIKYANGAYVRYANGTAAYSVWMQGKVQPSLIDYVLSTFYLNRINTSINGTEVGYAVVNNQTSICYLYADGWTKLVAYFNNSKAGSCLGIAGNSYAPEESNVIVAQLKANQNMTGYQQRFVYINSTPIGSAIIYSNSLSVVTFFENSYGFFTSFIQNTTSFEGPALMCRGLVYTSNTSSVCSVYIATTGNAPNVGLVNTTELTPSYRFSLYSLVNRSNLIAAHENGAALLNALKVSNVIAWKSSFSSTCGFSNASIGCNVTSFDYTNNIAHLSIINKLAHPLRINTMACFAPGRRLNETINTTASGAGTANVSVMCLSFPVPIASAYTNYALAMNYTYMNATMTIAGAVKRDKPGPYLKPCKVLCTPAFREHAPVLRFDRKPCLVGDAQHLAHIEKPVEEQLNEGIAAKHDSLHLEHLELQHAGPLDPYPCVALPAVSLMCSRQQPCSRAIYIVI